MQWQSTARAEPRARDPLQAQRRRRLRRERPPRQWLASIDGVKSLVILGHAGEGTFLTQDEQLE